MQIFPKHYIIILSEWTEDLKQVKQKKKKKKEKKKKHFMEYPICLCTNSKSSHTKASLEKMDIHWVVPSH